MSNNSTATSQTATSGFFDAVKYTLRGSGQVMFQESAWTGLLFLAGIFWGSYECGVPQVGWGAAVGLIVSTLAGYILPGDASQGSQGLYGFNGILVGCAFPTFLPDTWLMWVALVLCAMATTWVRTGFNNVMAPWKVNSLTFPFVFMTWMFLFAARELAGLQPTLLSDAALTAHVAGDLDVSFGHLVIYWLKGISQVFLVNSWVTGIFFLVGLALCSRWAAIWAAIGSAEALALAILFKADPASIASGLYGFSPVLTAIALGCTFYKVNAKSAIWTLVGVAVTFFIQAGMNAVMVPYGLPTLTGPFCIATWLFLLPRFNFTDPAAPKADHSEWHKL